MKYCKRFWEQIFFVQVSDVENRVFEKSCSKQRFSPPNKYGSVSVIQGAYSKPFLGVLEYVFLRGFLQVLCYVELLYVALLNNQIFES